jgi:multidrug efflux system membrane fusion protein
LFAAACSSSASAVPAQGPPPPAVGVATIELREVAPMSELTGRLEAVHHVDVRPRVSGYVTAVSFHEGAEVAAGAVLFTIDARPYQAAFARANAELARARARVELARTEAGRGERLLAASAIPRAERDTLASTATQAEAEAQSAQATLELARLDLAFTQVRAPVAGRTGRAIVNVGDYVAAGAAAVTSVVSIDPMYVYFTGDEATYLKFASHSEHSTINIGMSDEAGFPHTGKVDFVDNKVDASTGTILVRAIVANPDKRLAPGLFARVQLPEGDAVKVMLVDDKAVLTDQDRKYVYVLVGDSVERRDVKLGRIVEGQRVIAEGLKVGDRVIVNNIQKVFPGAKATVAKPPEQAAVNTKVVP